MAGKKYAELVFSGIREEMDLPYLSKPSAYFRGSRQIPGATVTTGWHLYTQPVFLEKEAHKHEVDEYLIFLGSNPADWFKSFDAEIEFYLGEEREPFLITKPTVVYVPAGLSHCPLNFRIMNEPVLLIPLLMSPVYTIITQKGKFTYLGPDVDNAPKPENPA
jgi:hypothetical protein